VDAEAGEAPRWMDVALADFNARRTSMVAMIQAAHNTLVFGATAVGILIAGTFNVWDERLLASIAFLVAIPLVCIFVAVQWAGQLILVLQLGIYLEGLEKVLREARDDVPELVMTWQEKFIGERPHKKWWMPDLRWHSSTAVVIFLLLAAVSIGLGGYRAFSGYEITVVTIVVVEGILLVLVAALLTWELATGYRRFKARRG
jgi:hypothetical protein